MHATDWLSFIASFAVVLALLGLVLFALKKMQSGSLLGLPQRKIRILDSVSIGPRQKIVLLRVKDEDILVGVTVQQINPLAGFPLTEEEIAAGDGSTSTIMSVHNSVGCMPVLKFGTDGQKARFLKPLARGEILGAFCLTEPHTGSDASNLRTRAVRKGNGWVLNGVKQFITSGRTADMALVFAVTDPASSKRGISCFIVPTRTPGYRVASVEKKLGQKSSDTCQIAFENCEVGADALDHVPVCGLARRSGEDPAVDGERRRAGEHVGADARGEDRRRERVAHQSR